MAKPGYKTTEFWVALLTIVGATVAALAGNLSPKYAALAAAVSTGLYAIGRGLAKVPTPVVPAVQTPPVPPPPA